MAGASKRPTSRGDLAPTSKRAGKSSLPWMGAPPYTLSSGVPANVLFLDDGALTLDDGFLGLEIS